MSAICKTAKENKSKLVVDWQWWWVLRQMTIIVPVLILCPTIFSQIEFPNTIAPPPNMQYPHFLLVAKQ